MGFFSKRFSEFKVMQNRVQSLFQKAKENQLGMFRFAASLGLAHSCWYKKQ